MTIRLSTLSYLVLGIVAEHEICTPYRIKTELGRSIGSWWPQPHSQIYDETARLAEHGLLAVSAESGGRRRRRYSLTPDGRTHLTCWLDDPRTGDSEWRDPALAKLRLLDPRTRPADRVRMHRLAIERVEMYRDRTGRDHPPGAEPAGFGEVRRLAHELDDAAARFWESLARATADDERDAGRPASADPN
ncbi:MULTISPECIES: PadR family transcriptional regulator [Pseudonocardia]|uniref:PadR family transcriptional regulator n=1 Tax=Pseudonocardia TaxID=1847 RepID=UPI0013029770|nr:MULTISPECIES: PadR family transcriptional regulator [Pseudonocardia]